MITLSGTALGYYESNNDYVLQGVLDEGSLRLHGNNNNSVTDEYLIGQIKLWISSLLI